MVRRSPFFRQVVEWFRTEEIACEETACAGWPFPALLLHTRRQTPLLLTCIDLEHWEALGLPERPEFLQHFIQQHSADGTHVMVLWEDLWYTGNVLIRSRILAVLGTSVRIPARLTRVKRIDKPTADPFLDQHHLQGSTAARYRYALYLPARYFRVLPPGMAPETGELLLAVATFGPIRNFERETGVWRSAELIRYASLQGCTVVGGLTRLLTGYTRLHTPDDVMTYTDQEWSAGHSLEKAGFTSLQLTPPLAFFVDTVQWRRYPEKHLDTKILHAAGTHFVKIHNAGNRKHVRICSQQPAPSGNIPSIETPPFPAPSQAGPLVFIAGPTASGKTALAVQLAYETGAEIISVDSRQVFRHMDIGTGKDLDAYTVRGTRIPVHLIDIRLPHESYSVFDFQKDFYRTLQSIRDRGKTVIACGGSGLYLEAVIRHFRFGESGAPQLPPYQIFCLNPSPERRRARITERLIHRLENGMIGEVRDLLAHHARAGQLERLGLEYNYLTGYLTGHYTREQMVRKLETEIHRFAKRQMTFFRKMERSGIPLQWVPDVPFQQQLTFIRERLNLS